MSKMKKYLDDLLYADCLIIPFEYLEGKIVAINISKAGIVYSVRYFLNGDYKIDDFFEFDIDLIKDS